MHDNYLHVLKFLIFLCVSEVMVTFKTSKPKNHYESVLPSVTGRTAPKTYYRKPRETTDDAVNQPPPTPASIFSVKEGSDQGADIANGNVESNKDFSRNPNDKENTTEKELQMIKQGDIDADHQEFGIGSGAKDSAEGSGGKDLNKVEDRSMSKSDLDVDRKHVEGDGVSKDSDKKVDKTDSSLREGGHHSMSGAGDKTVNATSTDFFIKADGIPTSNVNTLSRANSKQGGNGTGESLYKSNSATPRTVVSSPTNDVSSVNGTNDSKAHSVSNVTQDAGNTEEKDKSRDVRQNGDAGGKESSGVLSGNNTQTQEPGSEFFITKDEEENGGDNEVIQEGVTSIQVTFVDKSAEKSS